MRCSSRRIGLALAIAGAIIWVAAVPRGKADDCPDKCPVEIVCPNTLAVCTAYNTQGLWACDPQQSSDNYWGPFYANGANIDYNLSPNDGAPPMQPTGPANLKCYVSTNVELTC
jgi:hypothetical protein